MDLPVLTPLFLDGPVLASARTDPAELAKLLRRIEAGDLLMVTQLDRSASIIHGRSLELLNCHLFVWKRNLRNKHTGSV